MNYLSIDFGNCVGCGLCVNDCVNNYLKLTTEITGKKIVTVQERGHCLKCGHCMAICPQNAIIVNGILENTYNDDLLALMALKRTVRKYSKKSEIPKDSIDKILFAGQTAPTDRNRKSSRICLLKESLPIVYEKALDFLVVEVQKTGTINPLYAPTMKLNKKRDEILWNAEYLVLLIGSSKNMIDSAISAERMQLEACKLGIGTAYRGDISKAINGVDELRSLLEMKSNEEVLISFAMGMTDLKYYKTAVKTNHKVIYK